jgi:hypothetical protein
LEDTPNKITLSHDMNLKAVITLILGLVFQLAQVLPGAAATDSCAPGAVSCPCCKGLDSCPCADNGKSDEHKPAPLSSDSGSIFKLPAAKAGDTRVSIESLVGNDSSPTVSTSPHAGPSCGYNGVRLSVAFCSFVI